MTDFLDEITMLAVSGRCGANASEEIGWEVKFGVQTGISEEQRRPLR